MKKVFFSVILCMISIGLMSQQTTELNEAVVTATRASGKTPVAQTTLTKNDIKRLNLGVDIPYILELSPSVVVSSESGLGIGNTSFRIRGTDATRTNVTIDGIPVNDAESQGVYWANMPDFASSVNSIQIQRGVGTSTNGGAAFGATVNMQTTLPSIIPYAEISSSVGMYNSFRNTIRVGTGVIGAGFTIDARYSNVQSDGYINRSWLNHQSLYGALAWQGKKTFVKASVLYGEQHTGLNWNGVPGYAIDSIKYPYYSAGLPGYKPGINRRYNPAGEYRDNNGNISYYDNQSDNYEQTHYHLQFSYKFSDRWNVHTTIHLTRGIGYYEEYKLNRKFKEYALPDVVINKDTIKRSDLIRQKWMDNYFYGFTFSMNYKSEKLQWIVGGAGNRHDGGHYGKVLWTRYNTGFIPKNKWYNNNGTKDDYNIYTKATRQLNALISVYGDIQYRYVSYVLDGNDDDLAQLDQAHYFNFFNPKVGIYLNFDKNNSAYASFAVGNREPTRADFKDASKLGSSEAPKFERLYDVELGYQFKGKLLSLDINLYYMYYKDQLVLTGKLSSVGYPIMENVPESYRAGVELMGGVELAKSLRFETNLTISRNKIKDFKAYIDQYNNKLDWKSIEQRVDDWGESDISFSPNITGSALLKYSPINNLSLSLIGKYVGEQYYDNTSSTMRKLDSYLVNNLRVDYSFKLFGVNFGLQALINNLFNKQYITSAWVYRAVFSDGSADYVEDGFFPQAKRNVMGKLTVLF